MSGFKRPSACSLWTVNILLGLIVFGLVRHAYGQPIVPIFVSRIIFGSASSGVVIRSSTGSPESAVTAPIGSLFLRSDGGAGTALYVKESGSGNTGWVTLPGATVTASSTNTFTNKTLDTEGTGNVITVPFFEHWRPALCISGSASFDVSIVTANAPTATCVSGSQVTFGAASFADSGTQEIQTFLFLPSDWTSTVDLFLGWHTTATSGNVVWQIRTACVASGESLDPSWNTAQTITDAAIGTTNRANVASLTSVTTTGCAASETFYVSVFRDPTHASDDLGVAALLDYVSLKYRRAL